MHSRLLSFAHLGWKNPTLMSYTARFTPNRISSGRKHLKAALHATADKADKLHCPLEGSGRLGKPEMSLRALLPKLERRYEYKNDEESIDQEENVSLQNEPGRIHVSETINIKTAEITLHDHLDCYVQVWSLQYSTRMTMAFRRMFSNGDDQGSAGYDSQSEAEGNWI
ncbi:hypothetical protein TURU_168253 [Turdus rufiventris]|nr:hypothetical protein TURU_168253 [Turdus rufiventris]